MATIQWVRCPNCGDFAERQLLSDRQAKGCDYIIQTACAACDYLMIMGFPAGRVIEAYAPGQLSSMGLPATWKSFTRESLKHQSLPA